MRDTLEFFRQFRQRFETTGAVAPSSRFLASAMTRPLRHRPARPVRVLEVGPGTGAVTNHIVRLLRPGDQFDLVELNESFATILERRFRDEPGWQIVAPQCRVHVVPIQQFTTDRPYDYIVSGLPFNNFPAALVEEILAACVERLCPEGVLSMFEYMYVRSVRCRIGKRVERERIRAIETILQTAFDRLRVRRDWIFVNIPPAWVQHLKRPAD